MDDNANEFGADIGSMVHTAFAEPSGAAAGSQSETPTQTLAPEPPPQAPAGDQPAGQPAGGQVNPWERFLAPEQPAQPEDPWARFTREGLERVQDPAQLRAEAIARQEFLESNKGDLTTYGELKTLAEDLGGPEHIPTAIRMVKDLFWGHEPVDPKNPDVTHLDNFLTQLKTVSGGIYNGLVGRVVLPMLDPASGGRDYQFIRKAVLEAEGLPVQMLDQFKEVALAGGLQSLEIDTRVSDFLKDVPEHLHEMFRSLPAKIQKDYLKRDADVATYELADRYENWKRKQDEAQAAQARQLEENATRSFTTEKTFYNSQVEAVQSVVTHFKAQGLNDLEALGATAAAFMELEKSFWEGDQEAKTLFQDWRRHVEKGHQPGIKSVRGSYQQRLQAKATEICRAEAQRRLGKVPAQPQVPAGGGNRNFQQQYPADAEPGQPTGLEDLSSSVRQLLSQHGFGS